MNENVFLFQKDIFPLAIRTFQSLKLQKNGKGNRWSSGKFNFFIPFKVHSSPSALQSIVTLLNSFLSKWEFNSIKSHWIEMANSIDVIIIL